MKNLWIALLAAPLFTACLEDGTGSSAELIALTERLAALEAKVSQQEQDVASQFASQSQHLANFTDSFDSRMATQEDNTMSLEDALGELDASLGTLRTLVAGHEAKLTYVSVMDLEGKPAWVFRGVNVHLRNAAANESSDGTGNLVLGMNRPRPAVGTGPAPMVPRTGSYNLVIGSGHSYVGNYSMVAGANHDALASHAVAFGASNRAGSPYSVVFGKNNHANSDHASVLGGAFNVASAASSTIVGGSDNLISAASDFSVIGGGRSNSIGQNYLSTTIGGGTGVSPTYPGSFSP